MITSHRRQYDVISTPCARLTSTRFHIQIKRHLHPIHLLLLVVARESVFKQTILNAHFSINAKAQLHNIHIHSLEISQKQANSNGKKKW